MLNIPFSDFLKCVMVPSLPILINLCQQITKQYSIKCQMIGRHNQFTPFHNKHWKIKGKFYGRRWELNWALKFWPGPKEHSRCGVWSWGWVGEVELSIVLPLIGCLINICQMYVSWIRDSGIEWLYQGYRLIMWFF